MSSTRTDAELAGLHAARTSANGTFSGGLCPPALYGFLRSDAKVQAELEFLPINDQLRLMAGWSDNVAAATTINAVGHAFLWALSLRSGLVRRWPSLPGSGRTPTGPTGLCLTADYAKGPWLNPRPGLPAINYQAGCARSVATLMTLMARGELIGVESSSRMREMLRRDNATFVGRGEASPVGEGLIAAGLSMTEACSKIGMGYDDGRQIIAVDNAIIFKAATRASNGTLKPLWLAIVALTNAEVDENGAVSRPSVEALGAFGSELVAPLLTLRGLS